MRYPKISIVIPSFNIEDYIEETLQSIVNQKYPNLEVIIQDGGSTDGTVDIIKKYAKKYPKKIKWESKKDKGQTDAINKGLKKASGDIITFINGDDLYEKDALKKVGSYFAENPDILWLAGRGKVIDKKGNEIARGVTAYKNFLLNSNRYPLLLMVNYLMQPSVFLSRAAYQKYGPFTGKRNYILEYDMWLKIGRENMPNLIDTDLSKFRLFPENKSMREYNILEDDLGLVMKYTSNPIILFMHQLNNFGRRLIAKNI